MKFHKKNVILCIPAKMNRRVSDVLQKQLRNHSLDTYNSLSPLMWLLNLFSINNNVIKLQQSYSKLFYISKAVIIFIVLGSIDLFSLIYKNAYVYKQIVIASSIMLTDTIQMVFDLFQYLVDLCFVYKYGRHISVEYFKQYEHIDTVLGMTYYVKIKQELIKLLNVFTFIWISTSVCDYVAWLLSFGWITPTAYMISYLFLYVKILTTLDLSSHIMHIRFRLIIIRDILEEYYSITEALPGFKGDYLSEKSLYHKVNSSYSIEKKLSTMRLRCTDGSKEIDLLVRCYLQLLQQVELINYTFGFRILLSSLSLLIDIVRFTNTAVRIVLGTQKISNESRFFPAVCNMLRQVTCVLVLINLVTQAESVYQQSDRIINIIDHLLINKNPNDKLRIAAVRLRGLMQTRPINFNLANFFRLDNKMLVSIASVVVTYTIIILQSMN